ncbi:MAG TPA: hypothetical protein VGM89_08605 [Puia sp.]
MPTSTNRPGHQPAPQKPTDHPPPPAAEQNIDPKTRKDREEADANRHNGSAGAFEATEQGGDEEDDDK